MDNEISSRDERICVLKKSLNEVTNKLIRSYKVIARLNYQNNTMRTKLTVMRKTVPLLLLIHLSVNCFAQDDLYYTPDKTADIIPKKANTILITDSLEAEQNYNIISELLFVNGYGVLNADKTLGTITTTEKPLKHGSVRLTLLVKNNRVIIKGQVNINMDLSIEGVTAKSAWEEIRYAGARKSPLMLAWIEMNKIAEAVPGTIQYLVN